MTLRSTEVQVTHKYSGATPEWDGATVLVLTSDDTEVTIPALGGVKYAVRSRSQDVFGQYSAWSDVAEHTVLAGSDSLTATLATTATTADLATNLINGPATVTIDASGLTIEDGALILKDEFGETVMVASGFSGTWSDYIGTGLYNGRFLAGVSGVVPNGRTAALPYWTVSDVAGTPVATFMDPDVAITFSAQPETKRITSDPIVIAPGTALDYGVRYSVARSAGTLSIRVYYEVSDDPTFTFASGSIQELSNHTASTITPETLQGVDGTLVGKYARVRIEVAESAAHHASNSVTIHDAWLRANPSILGSVNIGGALQVVEGAADPVTVFGNFQVDGEVTQSGDLTVLSPGVVRIDTTGDASLASTGHGLQIGPDAGVNLAIDNNEIQARNNGAASGLLINNGGGDISLGTGVVYDDAVGGFSEYEGNVPRTYTPTVTNFGTATFSDRTGEYMKIGKWVFVRINLNISAAGAGGGNLAVDLPSSADVSYGRPLLMMSCGGLTGLATAGGVGMAIRLTGSGNGVTLDRLRLYDDSNIARANLTASSFFHISGWYREA